MNSFSGRLANLLRSLHKRGTQPGNIGASGSGRTGQTCWIPGFGVGESLALRGRMPVCPVLQNALLSPPWLLILPAILVARPATAAPGNPDNTFQQQGTIDGPICAVVVDSMTNIWIGGRFL